MNFAERAAERRAAYVKKVVDEAPPLTAEQRAKLAVLLEPARRQIVAARKAHMHSRRGVA